jgi:hypothetical protein
LWSFGNFGVESTGKICWFLFGEDVLGSYDIVVEIEGFAVVDGVKTLL